MEEQREANRSFPDKPMPFVRELREVRPREESCDGKNG